MRTVGLIHGMSSVATTDFYRRVNDRVNELCGGHERAEMLMASVNFAVIERCVRTEAWDEMGRYLAGWARALAAAGAEFLAIGSNTGHQVADAVEAATDLPLLHIADAVADAAADIGATQLGLVGTRPVMEGPYYRDRLGRRGIEVLVPDAEQREFAHRIVFDELTHNIFTTATRDRFIDVLRALQQQGAQAVVLGCTEYSLLVEQAHVPDLQLLDTTPIHVEAVVAASLQA